MNARRVNAAAGVILAAQKTKQTAAGIAVSLESACLLQSPESAAELVRLRARVAELEALTPARFQDCQVCGTGYEYGKPCSFCEFKKRVAAEVAATPAPRDLRPGAEAARRMIRDRQTTEDPHDSPLHHTYAEGRDLPPFPGACEACGDTDAQWCPDCAACQRGCFGGFNGNDCTHSNAPWRVTS